VRAGEPRFPPPLILIGLAKRGKLTPEMLDRQSLRKHFPSKFQIERGMKTTKSNGVHPGIAAIAAKREADIRLRAELEANSPELIPILDATVEIAKLRKISSGLKATLKNFPATIPLFNLEAAISGLEKVLALAVQKDNDGDGGDLSPEERNPSLAAETEKKGLKGGAPK
jgi:hypothetical protein